MSKIADKYQKLSTLYLSEAAAVSALLKSIHQLKIETPNFVKAKKSSSSDSGLISVMGGNRNKKITRKNKQKLSFSVV